MKPAVVDLGDAVDGREVGPVVGDQHGGGGAAVGEFGDQVDHGGAALVVQRAGGLVDQQHRRVVHQGAGDVDALALTAGELVRSARRLVAQSDGGQELQRAGEGAARGAAVEVGHHLELFGGGERGQQVGLLEDDADPAATQRRQLGAVQSGGLDAVHHHPAGVRGGQRGGDRQQAGLAGAGRADHRGDRALRHGQRDVVQRGQLLPPSG